MSKGTGAVSNGCVKLTLLHVPGIFLELLNFQNILDKTLIKKITIHIQKMTQRLAGVSPQVKVTQKSQTEVFIFVLYSEEFRPR